MNHTIALSICLSLPLFSFAGCGSESAAPEKKITVATPSVRLDWAGKSIDETLLKELSDKAPNLTDAILRGAEGDISKAVELLANCPNFKSLDLGYTEAGDLDVEKLVEIKSLKTLHLVGSKISDQAATHLAHIPSLVNLNIGDTAVSNTAVESIARLENLETLHIGATQIDDASAQQFLNGFRKLRLLRVGDRFSSETVEKLNESRPNITIE